MNIFQKDYCAKNILLLYNIACIDINDGILRIDIVKTGYEKSKYVYKKLITVCYISDKNFSSHISLKNPLSKKIS